MERLGDNVYIHRVDATEFLVTSAIVFLQTRVFVFDTSISPQVMEPVKTMLEEQVGDRRVVVVNSHHHWDHTYGNAAFAGYDTVAHRTCRKLMISQGRSSSESLPLPPAEGVPLPTMSFGDRLGYVDDLDTVHLIHTPGHTEDSIILYLDKGRTLLAGDTVEWPFPSLSMRDGAAVYVRTLRQLKQLPVDTVVPSHGPWMGKAIIDANERYVAGVFEAVTEAKAKGVGRHKLDLPAERFATEGVEIDETYRRIHRDNLEWAFNEV
jgi:cyclase